MSPDPSGAALPFGELGVLAVEPDGQAVRCHVCGWAYANLPVHARRTHGLAPEEYGARFGLDAHASLVAPALARRRAELARARAAALRCARGRRRRDGPPTAAQRRAAGRAARYAALVAEGQTLQMIAAAEGITRQAVSAALRAHGYAARALRPPAVPPRPAAARG